MTPMMEQYFEVKNQYKDYVLFYRLGDFYEMFFDDAIRVSRELELTSAPPCAACPSTAQIPISPV